MKMFDYIIVTVEKTLFIIYIIQKIISEKMRTLSYVINKKNHETFHEIKKNLDITEKNEFLLQLIFY